MAFIKEPEHDPRDMNAHEQDELIVYHLKRIQVLLLLIALSTLFSAGFAARGNGFMVLPDSLYQKASPAANTHEQE